MSIIAVETSSFENPIPFTIHSLELVARRRMVPKSRFWENPPQGETQ